MTSTVLFVTMVIIAAILLFVSSLTATLGAANAYSSSFYNSSSKIRSAHQYLTISAAMGWSALAVLIIILIVAAVAGGFSTVEVSEILLTKTNPTKEDLVVAYKGEKELSSGHITQIVVLIILIIIAIITLIVGILSAVAAFQLAGVINRDSKSQSAYVQAIISAVSGIGGIGIMIVAVIAYVSIRSARNKKLKDIEEFEKKVEKQLGVVPNNTTTEVIVKN